MGLTHIRGFFPGRPVFLYVLNLLCLSQTDPERLPPPPGDGWCMGSGERTRDVLSGKAVRTILDPGERQGTT